MKKSALIVLLVGLVSFGGFAQDRSQRKARGQKEDRVQKQEKAQKEERVQKGERPTPEKRAEMQTKRMQEELGLDDAQYQKVYAINLNRAKQNHEKVDERRELMKAEREAYQKDLQEVLTPEQMKKLDEKKARANEGRKDMRSRNAKRPANKRGN